MIAELIAVLLACTAATGKECGVAVWSDGRQSPVLTGTADSLSWGWGVTAATQIEGACLALWHTHPKGSPLSARDREMSRLPGVCRVCAVMPDGRADCTP